mgnify:CR=1 FL=1|jgi:hypothetical protein
MQTVYKTNDGKIFDTLWQAQNWEKEHCPTKEYTVGVYVKIPAIVTVSASNDEEAITKAKQEWEYADLSDNYEVLEAEIYEKWEE